MGWKRKRTRRGLMMYSVLAGMAGAAGVIWMTRGQGSMRGAELMEKAKTFMQKPNLSQTLLELGTEWSDELEEVVRENRKSKAESNHEDSDMGKMIQEVLDDEQSES